MKIAILSPFYPYRGGIAQFSGRFYSELIKKGHKVKAFNFKRLYPGILFPGKTQYIEPEDEAQKIENVRILDSINPFSYSKTVRKIREFNPDVLIISYWMSFFVPAYAHVANRLRKKCRIVTLIHNAIPHESRFLDKPLARLLFSQSDAFIVMSENVVNDLEKLKPGSKYVMSPHPLYDHFGSKLLKREACNQLGLNHAKRNLLFFGLIRDYKGLDLLLEAFGKLDDNYQLIIAGECYGSFERYQQQIDNLKNKENILVLNRYIKDEEVRLLFSASDVLVLPYRSATQSGVVSVAFHFDLPMIATPVGDFSDSIRKTNTGIVVNEISSEALFTGIVDFFDKGCKEYLEENIAVEKKKLSWEAFTGRVICFIRELGLKPER